MRTAAAGALLLIAGCTSAASGSDSAGVCEDAGSQTACQLATLDNGHPADDGEAAAWQARLDQLGDHCTNTETDIADIITVSVQQLKKYHHEQTYHEVADGLLTSLAGSPPMECSQVAAAYVTIASSP